MEDADDGLRGLDAVTTNTSSRTFAGARSAFPEW